MGEDGGGQGGVPVVGTAEEGCCCGIAATLVKATARERTTSLVLASIMSVWASKEKCNGGERMKEGRGRRELGTDL